ncbi:MAG: hypothetical protein DRP78_00995 [Candidatus Omnitrophota bacterium]|nr:MAG: hypothetical protein DRP78_00995 [Candidatus Omnitrophota bacterium]
MFIQVLVIQVIIFLVLFIGLRFLFSRQLNLALQKLQHLQHENSVKESELQDELDRAKREAEAEIEMGREEANKIKEEAKKTGNFLKIEMENKGRKEVKNLLEKSIVEIKQNEISMQKKAVAYSIDISLHLLKHIFRLPLKHSFHRELVDEFINEIDLIEENRLSAVKFEQIKVICACALEPSQKDRLKAILDVKLERDIEFEQEINEGIIGGVILKIGTFLVDGSIKNRLTKALDLIKKDIKF